MQIVINHELPTLNRYIGAERTNRYIAAKIKKAATDLVAYSVRDIEPINYQADYTFTWFRPNKRSDPDNIAFAQKFVFDGLMEAGKLPNDSMRYVRSITHFFEVGDFKVVVDVEEA